MLVVIVVVSAVLLSGCAQRDAVEPRRDATGARTDGANDVPAPDIGDDVQAPDVAVGPRRSWNFSYAFAGDTIAVGFVLTEVTRFTVHERLTEADFGENVTTRHLLGALGLYEAGGGFRHIYATSLSVARLGDHYYHIETPVGVLEDEDYVEVGRSKFGENNITIKVPPGEWTLVFMVPGAIHVVYEHELSFDVPVAVTGPVWGPLGFNHDERAFQGPMAVVTSDLAVQYERSCRIQADHTLIATVQAVYFGPHRLDVSGPDGLVTEYVSMNQGSYERLPDLETMPLFHLLDQGAWTYTVRVGVGGVTGYAYNLMGVDVPLPSAGYGGYHADEEEGSGCL